MTGTPRDLDPKFKTVETPTAPEETQVVHIERYTENGVQHERRHGPMPISEWPAYEKENNL